MSPGSTALASLAVTIVAGLPAAASAQNAGARQEVVGARIADGQAYATVVVLDHQADPADNGRMLLAFEENGYDGIPIWESTDGGDTWQFVDHARDPLAERPRCEMHWQPHLTEMPRTEHGISAGTVLLSASTVCQRESSGRGPEQMFLRLFTSNDFGRSWDYVSTYAEGTGEAPVWEPHLQILDDGTFVQFYSDETHKDDGYNQLLGHKISTDGGQTWGPLIFDTAFPGGVERPGMVIIDDLPNGDYVYNYEAVASSVSGQVHLKFSSDGLDWGDHEDRGIPVETQSGRYPRSTPNVFWFPIGGPQGVLVVTSRSADGPAADSDGNTLFWNNNLGVGPWWTAPTPVQKIGNNRAGWTQAMILRPDGRLLHITSSGSRDPARSGDSRSNEILFNAAEVDFNRYEAESAGQQGAAIMRDGAMSNGAKSRLGANDVGKLTFDVYIPAAGTYDLAVNYTDIGFDATPRLSVNGTEMTGSVTSAPMDPEREALRARDLGTRTSGEHRLLTVTTALDEGEQTIEVAGGDHALDVDYLQITPAAS